MNTIVCFGELLLRFSPDAAGNWIQSGAMPVYVGGAELNVATALANWQLPVKYCTALPDNLVAQHLHTYLQQKKIGDSIIHHGNRIGTYYLPQGSDLKHAAVIYDRAHSSFAQLQPGMINWDDILNGADWFHFSAITPALNENLVAVCKEALEAATAKNITISVDLNHRAKLWQWGEKPYEVMPQLVEHCHLIMGNIWSAESLLHIPVDENIHAKAGKETYLQHASQTAHHIMKIYSKCTTVAQTFRFDEGDGIRYFGTIDTKENGVASTEFYSQKIKDKAGSGDCFMAGLIYGIKQNFSLQTTVNFAAAAAFGKLHETGDSTKQTAADVENMVAKFMGKMMHDIIETIQQQGVLPLYYDYDKETSVAVLKALHSAGISAVEYTNRGKNAFENFKAMKAVCQQQMPGMKLGIGTIKNEDDAKLFASAGADFIICPGVVPSVAEVAKEYGIFWIPGCLTPTEIIVAEQLGAKLVKLFPGNLLGASYVSAIKDIFPELLFMPTGGVEVTEDNISGWFTAGVCAVGLGSKVISKELLKNKDYTTIENKMREALEMVKRLR